MKTAKPAASRRSTKGVMPTFQQLGLTSLPIPKPPSKGKPAVETMEEETRPIEVDNSFEEFPDSANVFHHIVSPSNSDENDIMMLDVTPIPSAGRLESAAGTSRMAQWDDTINEDTFTSLAMPLDGLIGGATKELDYALADDHDNMSVVASEATAVTGNVSGFNSRMSSYSSSSTTMKKVTSQVSPPNKDHHRDDFREWVERKGTSNNNIEVKQRDESPEPLRPRRLGMCGAIDVDDEIKESIQDVNATVKQILSVRPFGPGKHRRKSQLCVLFLRFIFHTLYSQILISYTTDERDAVRETFKDFKTSFRKKVHSALLLPTNCNPGSDRKPMDKNNKTRYDKDLKKREEESAVLKVRRLEILQQETDLDECEEVVYDKSSQSDPEPTRMLV